MTLPMGLVAAMGLAELSAAGRRRPEARRRDAGSLAAILIGAGLGYFLAFQPRCRAQWPLPAWAVWLGAALALAGIAFRVWAVRILGANFTRSVQVSRDQPIVQAGPYRWVRHPAYAGSLASALGIGLSLGSALSCLLILAPLALTIGYRIVIEERALRETLGSPYAQYCGRTKRLIPFVV